MSDKINIEAILSKYSPMPPKGLASRMAMKAAIKEIVEAVIDRCAEKAEAELKLSKFTNDDWYATVDKESILNIKKEITYD